MPARTGWRYADHCQGRVVDIDVTDDGTAAGPPATGGFGLLGMRERVSVYGGTVQAGTATAADTGSTPGCRSRPARLALP